MALCDRLEAARVEREATRDRMATASLARLNAPDPDPATFQNHAAFALNNLTPLTTRPGPNQSPPPNHPQPRRPRQARPTRPKRRTGIGTAEAYHGRERSSGEMGKLPAQKPYPPLATAASLELPSNWRLVRLGDVIKLWNGFAFKSGDFQTHGIPVVRIGDLQAGDVTLSNAVCVSKQIAESVGQEIWVPIDSLLIAMSGATTGKVAFNRTGEKLLLNQRVGRIETFFVDVNFVRFFFDTIVARNLEISFGTAIPNLSAKQINETVIPLPPSRRTTPHRRQGR